MVVKVVVLKVVLIRMVMFESVRWCEKENEQRF